MRASRTHFEQIPVETVKKIAIEMRDEITSPLVRWREVAQQVQQEQDPTRMIELVQQLVGEFDAEEIRKRERSGATKGL